jgi:hypothetical protein
MLFWRTESQSELRKLSLLSSGFCSEARTCESLVSLEKLDDSRTAGAAAGEGSFAGGLCGGSSFTVFLQVLDTSLAELDGEAVEDISVDMVAPFLFLCISQPAPIYGYFHVKA